MEKEIVINQSFDKKTLIEVSTHILLNGRIIIYVGILILMMIADVILHLEQDEPADFFTFFPFMIPILIFFGIWYSTKRTLIKNYHKNTRYYNNVTFTLTRDSFVSEGQDFKNKVQWESYHKIKEKNKWFLIYINKHQAHVIDKAQLKGTTIEEARAFFRSLSPTIKVSLK